MWLVITWPIWYGELRKCNSIFHEYKLQTLKLYLELIFKLLELMTYLSLRYLK